MNVLVSELKEYPFSKALFEDLKTTDYDALKNDIAKHGIKVSLHILPNKTVICGHQRLRAARELGLKTAPCKTKDLKTDVEIREWAIKDNLLRRQLTPEQRYLLYAKLSEVYEMGRGGDRRSTEFQRNHSDSFEKEDVLERTAKEVGESPATVARARAYRRAIEEMPELKDKGSVISVLNEYQRRRDIKKRKDEIKAAPELKNLMLGDAREKIDAIPDGSIDAWVIDPPYGLNFRSGFRQQTSKLRGKDSWRVEGDTDDIFDILDELFLKMKNKLKNNAHIYIFTSWKKWHKLYSVTAKHFEVKNCLVWDKCNTSIGELQGYNYRECYEFILFATKGNRKLNFDNGVKPANIIRVPRVGSNRRHPTEKPVDLLKQLISYSTVEKETVADFFCGAGSTLVAAEELGRNWIGIEINPHWYDLAKSRILELRKNNGGVADA